MSMLALIVVLGLILALVVAAGIDLARAALLERLDVEDQERLDSATEHAAGRRRRWSEKLVGRDWS